MKNGSLTSLFPLLSACSLILVYAACSYGKGAQSLDTNSEKETTTLKTEMTCGEGDGDQYRSVGIVAEGNKLIAYVIANNVDDDSAKIESKKAVRRTKSDVNTVTYADSSKSLIMKVTKTGGAQNGESLRGNLSLKVGSELVELEDLECFKNSDISFDIVGETANEGQPVDSDSISTLRSAIKLADIPELVDFGTSFDVSTHTSKETVESILRVITDTSPDSDRDLPEFVTTQNAAAVKQFTEEMKRLVTEEEEDESNLSKINALSQIAKEVETTFLPVTKFKSVSLLVHTIAEDGDVEYQILIGENGDGSKIVLSYSNFPF